MEPLGSDVSNFRTEKAYQVFVCCSDNHKAWQSLEIFLYGTVLEPFHIHIKETGVTEPNAIGFLKWQKAVKPSNLKVMLQLVLKFALGIYIQRIGDRHNDSTISDAGRFAFMDLFYGFKHPLYQELEYQDLKNKATYPEALKKQRQQNLTYSLSKDPGRCQGGDFMLEQKVNLFNMDGFNIKHNYL